MPVVSSLVGHYSHPNFFIVITHKEFDNQWKAVDPHGVQAFTPTKVGELHQHHSLFFIDLKFYDGDMCFVSFTVPLDKERLCSRQKLRGKALADKCEASSSIQGHLLHAGAWFVCLRGKFRLIRPYHACRTRLAGPVLG